MPKQLYVAKSFTSEHELVIARANTVITEYAGQGFDLTLRQLYYQFVARGWLPNNDRSYKRLGSIISEARRAGLIDWEAIVDRTRFIRQPTSWESPAAIEKDALVGVLEVACAPWHCSYFSCRGYTSDSEIWGAAQRLIGHVRGGQTPVVFHLGDHDPSGIDMSRDITDRLRLFAGRRIKVKRIALNMEQVEELNPPPNPAKQTDSRFQDYQEQFGDESWELDALDPNAIAELIRTEMEAIIDPVSWAEAEARRDEGRRLLTEVSDQWDTLTEGL